jgi:hypothetical protein
LEKVKGTLHQCRIPQPQVAGHLQNCTIILIQVPPQT